jgi:hypothetical protein
MPGDKSSGKNAWLCSTALGENQRKILPVVGRRRETYNIWGVGTIAKICGYPA